MRKINWYWKFYWMWETDRPTKNGPNVTKPDPFYFKQNSIYIVFWPKYFDKYIPFFSLLFIEFSNILQNVRWCGWQCYDWKLNANRRTTLVIKMTCSSVYKLLPICRCRIMQSFRKKREREKIALIDSDIVFITVWWTNTQAKKSQCKQWKLMSTKRKGRIKCMRSMCMQMFPLCEMLERISFDLNMLAICWPHKYFWLYYFTQHSYTDTISITLRLVFHGNRDRMARPTKHPNNIHSQFHLQLFFICYYSTCIFPGKNGCSRYFTLRIETLSAWSV